ncbi:MAG: YifB family Mg chelatase-like AAA ATPase [Steroidobacterales bacterium]
MDIGQVAKNAGISTVLSRAPRGLDAPLVRVEVHIGAGLPAFQIVGLPETVVRESKERVRSALLNAGFEFPAGRITVNLSPADLPKAGGRFDLPIAIGILAASRQLPRHAPGGKEFYGELSLSGELRETSRLLPALLAGSRRPSGEIILPAANALEASMVRAGRLRLAGHLTQVCEALRGERVLDTPEPVMLAAGPPAADLADVRGQLAARRALEIAAAGEHAMLMIGPPGAGKTLLAQRLIGLLPPLLEEEMLEVASLASAAGARPARSIRRPFRSPHHTASVAALIGGGVSRPGELSLAHRGVLFLDELPEFAHNVLEALREPMETGVVALSRATGACEWPAKFQLIAAMNPCPCGYAGDPRGRCGCTAAQVKRYRERISGPLVDRIDIHVEFAALPADELLAEQGKPAEHSAAVAARVACARLIQLRRQGMPNARLPARELRRLCPIDKATRTLIGTAIARLGLSARAYDRILKLARTSADLAGETDIGLAHAAEAVQLRALDRGATC